MRSRWILVLCAGWSLMMMTTEAIDPFSVSLGVGIGAAVVGLLVQIPDKLCDYQECCIPKWISYNEKGLEADLQRKLFGQHVASHVILKAVSGFMNNKNPNKPLVLSLHGWTGTGKNFVSKIIAENIYQRGMKSGFVHLFSSMVHVPHEAELEQYKLKLKQWIEYNVNACPHTMFIFDEMDKMHPDLVDSIKPFLAVQESLNGVSYHKAIFIFLSNAGGKEIAEVTLDYLKIGWEREKIELRHLKKALSLTIFNDEYSGLWHTSLIHEKLVDFIVPFLPLEYKHIVQCAQAEMSNRGRETNKQAVEQMAREMKYFPNDEPVFAEQGCKVISNRLNFYI